MGSSQSEVEQIDFEISLHKLSREMLRLCYLNRPVIFDWYHNDYLYTNIRYVALVVGACTEAKWMFPYEFWSMSMGPVLQSRHFFKIRYHNGFYVLFENDGTPPFESDLSARVEELLRDDNESESVMEIIRAICAITGVLLSPQFVTLTRKARNSNGLQIFELF
jgi:hypothetical protein